MRHYLLFVMLVLGVAHGCSGRSQPMLHGKVIHRELPNLKFLEDSIELQSVSDPTLFAFGQLNDRGEFVVESLSKGKIVRGAPAGKYRVRFIIAEDDIDHKRTLGSMIDEKFLSFDSSGWSVEVPGDGVILELTGRPID